MPRTIRRRKTVDIEPLVHHYLGQRMLRERAEREESRGKKELMEILESTGEKDHEGHRHLPVTPQPYTNPKGEEKTVNGVQRQRRVSQVIDAEAAEKLLRRKKLWDDCTETVTVLSEDKILAANYEGKITDKELAALYGELEQFAFLLEYE
jgi:hypothetical protein